MLAIQNKWARALLYKNVGRIRIKELYPFLAANRGRRERKYHPLPQGCRGCIMLKRLHTRHYWYNSSLFQTPEGKYICIEEDWTGRFDVWDIEPDNLKDFMQHMNCGTPGSEDERLTPKENFTFFNGKTLPWAVYVPDPPDIPRCLDDEEVKAMFQNTKEPAL